MDNTADLTQLTLDLTRAAADIPRAVDDLLNTAAAQIQAEAQNTVHVKTGNLRSSIRTWSEPLRKVIGPDSQQAPYGVFLEYGTGTRGEFPTGAYTIRPKNVTALKFRIGTRVIFARSVTHPGISAYPYMRPALSTWLGSLGDDAAKVGVQMIIGPGAS